MKTTKKSMYEKQLTFIMENARIWENNPIDHPTASLTTDDYHTLLRAMIAMPSVMSIVINKRSQEWDYFSTKWDTLFDWRRVDVSADELETFTDVFGALNRSWEIAKISPYTYRCLASLIRSLGDC